MDDFISILGKGFVPETADQVAEAGILTEGPGDGAETISEAEVSPISPEPLLPDPETFWAGPLKTLKKKILLPLRLILPPVPSRPYRRTRKIFPLLEQRRGFYLRCWKKIQKASIS